MMTIMGLVVAYATLLVAGGGTVLFLFRSASRFNVIECLCLAWLSGIGIISLSLAILGNFFHGLVLQISVTAVCILAGYAGWQTVRHRIVQWDIPRPRTVLEWALFTVLIIQLGTILYAAMNSTLGWDGLLVWEIKARYGFSRAGVLPGADFQVGHPEYPLGLPLVQMWSYLWLGEANQFWAKLMFPVFYGVGIALLGIVTTRITGHRLLGLITACLLYFVPQMTVGTGGAISGYADFPLAVFYFAAIGYLLLALQRPDGFGFPVFVISLAILPWIKQEGIVLWTIAAVAGVLVLTVQRQPRQRLILLLPGLGIFVAWHLFLHTINLVTPPVFMPVSLANLIANLYRLKFIVRVIYAIMVSPSDWSCLWILALLAVLATLRQCRNLSSLILLASILIPLGIYAGTYIFSTRYLDHVVTSVSRLMMHVVPIVFLMIAGAVARAWAPLENAFPRATQTSCPKTFESSELTAVPIGAPVRSA